MALCEYAQYHCAPGLGSPRPHLHRRLAHACPHLRLDSPSPAVAGVTDLALSDRATVPPCEYSQYRCVSTRSPRAGVLAAPVAGVTDLALSDRSVPDARAGPGPAVKVRRTLHGLARPANPSASTEPLEYR